MTRPVLEIRALCKAYGGLVVTDDIDLDVRDDEIHAVIGPNGAGKTTLIGQISGAIVPDAGEIHFIGQDITAMPVHERARLGLSRSFQITAILPAFSVRENVLLAVQGLDQPRYRLFPARHEERLWLERAEDALERTGLSGKADMLAGNLSHGEKRSLEMAISLARAPRLILLDEPMAGTGHEESVALLEVLQGLKGHVPILLVEHDMDAVFALADRISVLVYGRIIASGTPEDIRANAEVQAAYLGDETEGAA